MLKPENDGHLSEAKLVLRPLFGLMSGQPPDEIERHLVRELEKHRRLREGAVMMEAAVEQEPDLEIARAYIAAMIAVHAQQTVVSTLLDILGYMPEMPRTTGH
ncbi:hypothetical protein O8B93_21945 [Agrobacterium rhizogenes]|uniref:transcriptional repressor TraM n=1 Tax=Rhizobium rhizogenes TaxID=359 RepID=UPI0022B613C0|nr:transcriptional repressor TraM [Rhizobium rhizogenes]MCZ7450250.1 hypothetical protein [Rhizobium rhizogenes]